MAREHLEKFVFIVTYGRSGSTLLQKILQSIEGYCIRGENELALLALYRSVKRARVAHYRYGRQALPADHPWYGADEIDPEHYARRLADVFVDEILRPAPACRVSGFKEIRYFAVGDEFEEFLDFIRENFSPCQILFNKRRAESVAQSSWYRKSRPEEVVEMVKTLDARFDAYQGKHPSGCHTVVYDEYVNDPSTLSALFGFLGERFSQSRIEALMARRLTH